MCKLIFPFASRATTVATIVSTTAVIVVVVAVAVTFVEWSCAVSFAFFGTCCFRGIQAFACLAVRVLEFVSVLPAAITIVPIAAANIVFIVTATISHICGDSAFFVLWTLFRFRWVHAFADRAIIVLILVTAFTATVTSIPATTTVVVAIVAAFVASPRRGLAFSAAFFHDSRLCLGRVQAFAGLTIIKLPRVAS